MIEFLIVLVFLGAAAFSPNIRTVIANIWNSAEHFIRWGIAIEFGWLMLAAAVAHLTENPRFLMSITGLAIIWLVVVMLRHPLILVAVETIPRIHLYGDVYLPGAAVREVQRWLLWVAGFNVMFGIILCILMPFPKMPNPTPTLPLILFALAAMLFVAASGKRMPFLKGIFIFLLVLLPFGGIGGAKWSLRYARNNMMAGRFPEIHKVFPVLFGVDVIEEDLEPGGAYTLPWGNYARVEPETAKSLTRYLEMKLVSPMGEERTYTLAKDSYPRTYREVVITNKAAMPIRLTVFITKF